MSSEVSSLKIQRRKRKERGKKEKRKRKERGRKEERKRKERGKKEKSQKEPIESRGSIHVSLN